MLMQSFVLLLPLRSGVFKQLEIKWTEEFQYSPDFPPDTSLFLYFSIFIRVFIFFTIFLNPHASFMAGGIFAEAGPQQLYNYRFIKERS